MDKIRFSHIMENYLVEARQDPASVFPSQVLARLRSDGVIASWPTTTTRAWVASIPRTG